jgi:GT2 family glycosyltransferase
MGNMANVSVIIPTYNRVRDVDACLDSILAQKTLPLEVILVDDSEGFYVENLARHRKAEFENKTVKLEYIKNRRGASSTIARNIGADNADADILLFLDSDVVLENDYISEILNVYNGHPEAKAVQGIIRADRYSLFSNILGRLHILIFFQEVEKCRVFPSLTVSYPDPTLNKVINCQWLSGANASFKKEILKEFRWDENLKKYAWGDDIDLPYRIYKKYPNELYMTPYARLTHKSSTQGESVVGRDVIYMEEVYYLYIFYKVIDQNIINKLTYLESRIGRLILRIIHTLRHSKSKIKPIKHLVGALVFCLKHKSEIRNGNLGFFNKTITTLKQRESLSLLQEH